MLTTVANGIHSNKGATFCMSLFNSSRGVHTTTITVTGFISGCGLSNVGVSVRRFCGSIPGRNTGCGRLTGCVGRRLSGVGPSFRLSVTACPKGRDGR